VGNMELKPWISPHNKILALYDEKNNVIELIEDHARGTCIGGAAWSLYHYPRNSPCIFWSKREGSRLFFKIKPSVSKEISLVPSYYPACIESVIVENNKIKVTYSGLAGAGVAAIGRTYAEGIENFEVVEYGGGRKFGKVIITLPKKEKIVIGIDDTDKKDEGATYSLVNEIAYKLSLEMKVDYIEHSIVQLYPENPFKTQNCVSVAVSFAVFPHQKNELIEGFRKKLEEYTLSEETGMAVFGGIIFDDILIEYAKKAKSKIITIDETYDVASKCNVRLIKIKKGERGLIGALAALPYIDYPDDAVKLGDK